MKQVTIYTTPVCPYCVRAKDLLTSLGIPYTEVDVVAQPEERERINNEFHWQTVPAVFIGEELIGGFDNLSALQQKGELMPKLQD